MNTREQSIQLINTQTDNGKMVRIFEDEKKSKLVVSGWAAFTMIFALAGAFADYWSNAGIWASGIHFSWVGWVKAFQVISWIGIAGAGALGFMKIFKFAMMCFLGATVSLLVAFAIEYGKVPSGFSSGPAPPLLVTACCFSAFGAGLAFMAHRAQDN